MAVDAAVWRFAGAAVIGICGVLAANFLAGGIQNRGSNNIITVTGSARKNIDSDFIIWRGDVQASGVSVTAAYNPLKANLARVREFLTKNGVKNEEIFVGSISTSPTTATFSSRDAATGETISRQQITGYNLTQPIEVRSNNVDLLARLSSEVTDLIATGVSFQSYPPQFIYTKINEEKVAILGEASKDARRRAEEIAKNAGGALGKIRFARMSPLQITPRFSNEVTYDGQNDTTSREKAITAIVTIGVESR